MGSGVSVSRPTGEESADDVIPTEVLPKKRKKASAAERAGSETIVAILEDASVTDEEGAERIRQVKKIDPYWQMNLLHHDEEAWGLLHIAVSTRGGENERLACLGALLERKGKGKLDVTHRVNGCSRFAVRLSLLPCTGSPAHL